MTAIPAHIPLGSPRHSTIQIAEAIPKAIESCHLVRREVGRSSFTMLKKVLL